MSVPPGWQRAWVGLGANLDEPVEQLHLALRTIETHPQIIVTRVSSLYRSAPVGYDNQPDFYNAVCKVATSLSADALLNSLLLTENAIGRVRKGPRFGPRRVDLDLLLYENLRIESPRLSLPHPRMAERRFVLEPLLELAPDITIPGLGLANHRLAQCMDQVVERVNTDADSGGGARAMLTRIDWPG